MTALTAAWGRVPNAWKVDGLLWPLLVVGWAAAFATGLLVHAPTLHSRSVTRLTIQQQYGTPTETVAGSQVNSSFAGLTCAIYQARSTVICAP